MQIRTWMIEAAVVAAALSIVAIFRGSWVEWVGAGAVLFSFMHGQIADRHSFAERMAGIRGEGPQVECWKWSGRYYLAKEILWVVYFIEHHSWNALVGCGLFLIYPLWRRYWTSRRPGA